MHRQLRDVLDAVNQFEPYTAWQLDVNTQATAGTVKFTNS